MEDTDEITLTWGENRLRYVVNKLLSSLIAGYTTAKHSLLLAPLMFSDQTLAIIRDRYSSPVKADDFKGTDDNRALSQEARVPASKGNPTAGDGKSQEPAMKAGNTRRDNAPAASESSSTRGRGLDVTC